MCRVAVHTTVSDGEIPTYRFWLRCPRAPGLSTQPEARNRAQVPCPPVLGLGRAPALKPLGAGAYLRAIQCTLALPRSATFLCSAPTRYGPSPPASPPPHTCFAGTLAIPRLAHRPAGPPHTAGGTVKSRGCRTHYVDGSARVPPRPGQETCTHRMPERAWPHCRARIRNYSLHARRPRASWHRRLVPQVLGVRKSALPPDQS